MAASNRTEGGIRGSEKEVKEKSERLEVLDEAKKSEPWKKRSAAVL